MDDPQYKSRIRALHIVLILSFIANGLGAFSNLMMSLPAMRSTLRNNMQLIPEVLHETYEMMLSIPAAYYIATAVFSAVAFFGCLRMWRLKGLGFHYYTLAKLLLIATPLVFIGRQYLNIGDVMMSLLFIAYYFISLRPLGAFSNQNDPNPTQDDDNPNPPPPLITTNPPKTTNPTKTPHPTNNQLSTLIPQPSIYQSLPPLPIPQKTPMTQNLPKIVIDKKTNYLQTYQQKSTRKLQ